MLIKHVTTWNWYLKQLKLIQAQWIFMTCVCCASCYNRRVNSKLAFFSIVSIHILFMFPFGVCVCVCLREFFLSSVTGSSSSSKCALWYVFFSTSIKSYFSHSPTQVQSKAQINILNVFFFSSSIRRYLQFICLRFSFSLARELLSFLLWRSFTLVDFCGCRCGGG